MVVTRRWRRLEVLGRAAAVVVGRMVGQLHVQEVLVVLQVGGSAFPRLGLPLPRLALGGAAVVLLGTAAELMGVEICSHGNISKVGDTTRQEREEWPLMYELYCLVPF